jgi:hypothetical protein
MKIIFKLLFLSVVVFLFSACEKDENKIYLEGGTAPVLTSSTTGTTLQLSFANKDMPAMVLNWTNPDYRFTTGVSSQNVTYQIEIDTVGANFTNPAKKTIAVSNSLSQSFTQNEFNDILLNQLNLKAGMAHNVEIRVTSTLANSSAKLTSNVLKYTVTPYALPPKIAPPTSQKLFIVGGATPGGWNNPVPVPTQEFKKISETIYEISVSLKSGESYLLLPVNGSWDVKYGANGGNNSNNPIEDDFKMGGGDLIAPPTTGTYKITVDFQRGKFSLTKI